MTRIEPVGRRDGVGMNGKGYQVAFRDYRRICSELHDERAFERSLLDLKKRIEGHLGDSHVGWVVAPDHTLFFEKLAERFGKEVRFVTVNSPNFKVVNGEKIIHAQNIVDGRLHVASVRHAIKSLGKVRDHQILPLVVAIASAPEVSNFRGMPIIALNQDP